MISLPFLVLQGEEVDKIGSIVLPCDDAGIRACKSKSISTRMYEKGHSFCCMTEEKAELTVLTGHIGH